MPTTNTTLRLLLRCRGLLRKPKSAWNTSAFDVDSSHNDDYFQNGTIVLAPAIWLAIVWVSLIVMLLLVGYLSPDLQDGSQMKALVNGYQNALRSPSIPDHPERRAALALSGVTAAITLALALAGVFWARKAEMSCETAHRSRIRTWVAVFLTFMLLVYVWLFVSKEPFASSLGAMLLDPKTSNTEAMVPFANFQGAWSWLPRAVVPHLMFALACVVPFVLLAGACFLLEPIARPKSPGELEVQLRRLGARLRELDQMLYIGALALVFGTLQLSGGLSLALTNQLSTADLKTRVDLCKAMSSLPLDSNPFFGSPTAAPTPSAPSPGVTARGTGASGKKTAASTASNSAPAVVPSEALVKFYAQCNDLTEAFSYVDKADGLKQMVRGITVACGLAFSALLAAIYVPALIVLRQMIEPRQCVLVDNGGKAEVAAADPIARLLATAATLSPLFAGLLANMLAGS